MLAIGVTDPNWFFRLSKDRSHQVVNWWTPTPWNIRGLNRGDRFYFLLKAPHRSIGGFGVFAEYKNLPASEAWQKFGTGNGVASLAELVERTSGFARKRPSTYVGEADPTLGCIVSNSPTLLDDAEFFTPEDCGVSFPRQIVKFKYFRLLDELAPTSPMEDFLRGKPSERQRRTTEEIRLIEGVESGGCR